MYLYMIWSNMHCIGWLAMVWRKWSRTVCVNTIRTPRTFSLRISVCVSRLMTSSGTSSFSLFNISLIFSCKAIKVWALSKCKTTKNFTRTVTIAFWKSKRMREREKINWNYTEHIKSLIGGSCSRLSLFTQRNLFAWEDYERECSTNFIEHGISIRYIHTFAWLRLIIEIS